MCNRITQTHTYHVALLVAITQHPRRMFFATILVWWVLGVCAFTFWFRITFVMLGTIVYDVSPFFILFTHLHAFTMKYPNPIVACLPRHYRTFRYYIIVCVPKYLLPYTLDKCMSGDVNTISSQDVERVVDTKFAQ